MIGPNRFKFLPIALILAFSSYMASAQTDTTTLIHELKLMDSLSIYKMNDYDTLYKISILYSSRRQNYKETYFGWVNKWSSKDIDFISIHGTAFHIEKAEVTSIERMPAKTIAVANLVNMLSEEQKDPMGYFGGEYLLSLWFYKKDKIKYCPRFLPPKSQYFNDKRLRDDFGILYYNAMLNSFTLDRNYSRAIYFGDHLSKNIFKGYRYQQEIITLTAQLRNNSEDFKSFRLPDSLGWLSLKKNLSRKDQIFYLADRLRLLNCVQTSQPGGISYLMAQFSIPYAELNNQDAPYGEEWRKYGVINPFFELLEMNLNLKEVELLLPYLLTDKYIASYTYFRDFRPSRDLHKLTWVVNSLIFRITDKDFLDLRTYDTLAVSQKKIAVEAIRLWCEDNATLSKEERTIKTLKTASEWVDFHKALETAKKEKYASLLPVIIDRFNDFKGGPWPANQPALVKTVFAFESSYRGIIAQTVCELGNEKQTGVIKQWSKDTTDIWVNLWTSLFLLKYDKDSHEAAMKQLESVLKQCDGTYYYPHAMDLLLSMNDKRALTLAEEILTKPRFEYFISWDYYLNFVKKLLLRKSDFTFDLINKKLGSFTPEETEQLNAGVKNMLMQSDFYVLAVEKLRGNKQVYDATGDLKSRLDYKKALSEWFTKQYKLLKQDKPNELLLNIADVSQPRPFIDAPRQ